MAKAKPDAQLGVLGHVAALLHKLPPGSLIVVAVAGLLGFLHIRGMDHGTEAAAKLAGAMEKQAAVQEAMRQDQLDYYRRVLVNQEKMVEGLRARQP